MAAFPMLIPLLHADSGARSSGALFRVLSDSNAALELRGGNAAAGAAPVGKLAPIKFGRVTVYGGDVSLSGLSENTRYEVTLHAVGRAAELDRALVQTWPGELRADGADFRLFLGSCFSLKTIRGGANLKGLHGKLWSSAPHLKVFCGDQVYLDIPLREPVPRDADALQELILAKYVTNWQQDDQESHYGKLLRAGSSTFMSDDHEFWNNYPYTPFYKPALRGLLDGRQLATDFKQTALRALGLFQQVPPGLRIFQLTKAEPSLTLITLDGRYARTPQAAHSPSDLSALCKALRACRGPVILVLSQPLFADAHDGRLSNFLATHITDRGLPDFPDYRTLVEAIAAFPHDVLILSGDIHNGRIGAQRAQFGNRHVVYEVVASPLSLVLPAASFGSSVLESPYPDLDDDKPKYAAAGPNESFVRPPIQTNHGALLSFSRLDRGFRVRVSHLRCDSGAPVSLKDDPATITLRSLP